MILWGLTTEDENPAVTGSGKGKMAARAGSGEKVKDNLSNRTIATFPNPARSGWEIILVAAEGSSNSALAANACPSTRANAGEPAGARPGETAIAGACAQRASRHAKAAGSGAEHSEREACA